MRHLRKYNESDQKEDSIWDRITTEDLNCILYGVFPFARKPSDWDDITDRNSVMIEDLSLDILKAISKLSEFDADEVVDVSFIAKELYFFDHNETKYAVRSEIESYGLLMTPDDSAEYLKMAYDGIKSGENIFFTPLALPPSENLDTRQESKHYVFIMHHKSKSYIVDTQGFDYIRYICEIKHFDELKWVIYDKERELN